MGNGKFNFCYCERCCFEVLGGGRRCLDWSGGGTTSIEVYVKYDSFNSHSMIFDFGSGEYSDNVYLGNEATTSSIRWWVVQGSTQKYLTTSNFDFSIWTHVVITVLGTNIKMYKNGFLAGSKTDGHEPNALTRSQHWLGQSAWPDQGYFNGTIAYVKVWHGVELQQSDFTSLYAPHKTAHHFWDFRVCSTGELGAMRSEPSEASRRQF